MPNHVQFASVAGDEDGLRRTFRYGHRHFAGFINLRMRVTGHLWQGRFSSVAMDEAHPIAALRYVARNPVRAGLVERAEDWRWSGTRAQSTGESDNPVDVVPAYERVGDFAAFPGDAFDEAMTFAALRKAECVGRLAGSKAWLADMEQRTGLTLAGGKRGPRPKAP